MLRNLFRSPFVWAAGEALIIGIIELIVIEYFGEPRIAGIILGTTFWLFISLAGFYKQLSDQIEKLRISSVTVLHFFETSEKLRNHLNRLFSEYDNIEHPLLKQLAEDSLERSLRAIEFNRQHSRPITHSEFGFAISDYVKEHVRSVRAFSRSSVTNWDNFHAASNKYFQAQKGKHVRRIFVLTDKNQYDHFATKIFPEHVKRFGEGNIFVCSEGQANQWIATLPDASQIEKDEDFAIFDDDVVAFCKGGVVVIRTDNLDRCKSVFESVKDFAAQQRCVDLRKNQSKVTQIFGT
jgi:hypothetical protein